MLKIKIDNEVNLTRGDSASLSVPIMDSTGKPYEVAETDTLRMTVRDRTSQHNIVFQKVIHGDNVFLIKPIDTQGAAFGSFVYDVELTQEDGNVYTVIGPAVFRILEEVTY